MMDFDEISYQAYLDGMAERYDFAGTKKCGEAYISDDKTCHKDKKKGKQVADLPEPKVHYLKDMDPYDPRRGLRQLAPGTPLPPASMRPGLPPRGLV